MIKRSLIYILPLLSALFGGAAHAREKPEIYDPCASDCVEVGAWQLNVGLGLGIRSNPLHQGDDIPLVLLPELNYYGERFFLKNLEMGFTLYEDNRHQINALITPGYDQMYFNRWDPFNFSDGGSSFSSTLSGPSFTSAANYRVNIVEQRAPPGEVEIGQAPGVGEITTSGVYVPQTQSLSINDQIIHLTNGAQVLFGVNGNAISIRVRDDVIDIAGLVAGDQILLSGVRAENLDNIEGRGDAAVNFLDPEKNITEGTQGSVSIGVNESGQYAIRAQAEDSSAVASGKIAAGAVEKRRMAGLVGVEYSYSLARVNLHMQALTDFTKVHDGQELRLAVIFPWQWGEQKWAFTLGGNYKSRKILEYYYGIDATDTDNSAFFFRPQSAGLEHLLRLDWQRPVAQKWSLRAMLQYSVLPNTIHHSPLVADTGVGSVFIGGVYHF